jgi:hypothetical protein
MGKRGRPRKGMDALTQLQLANQRLAMQFRLLEEILNNYIWNLMITQDKMLDLGKTRKAKKRR